MSRSTEEEPTATGQGPDLAQIMALHGQGSIKVTPRGRAADEPAHADAGANSELAPAAQETAAELPAADENLTKTDKLRALLDAQRERRAQPPVQSDATVDAMAGPMNYLSSADRPAVAPHVAPTMVKAPLKTPHPVAVKLPEPARRPTEPHARRPDAAAPAQSDARAPSDGGGDDLRHLPESIRSRLEAFASDAERPAPLPPVADPSLETSTGPRSSFSSTCGELKAAIFASKRAFVAAAVFSFFINLLMLTGPLFMLQVYDRVMASGSLSTLAVLFIMTAGLYAILGLLDLARARIVVRTGVEIDQRIGNRIFEAALRRSLTAAESAKHSHREMEHLRSFISGPGPMTMFDAPWTPVYLLVVFALHWVLGVAATLGAIILMALALFSEMRSRRPLQEASSAAATSIELAETGLRNAEAITAMGMLGAYRARWQQSNSQSLAWQMMVADRIGSTAAISKAVRLLMQSTMLAIGAVLALQNEISAGTIVAATIIFGRALAPVEQAIGQWRGFVRARDAFFRLSKLLDAVPPADQRMTLPPPAGNLRVENLRVAAPDTRKLILTGINFAVAPGQMLAVIGPSASGKSTLVRTLAGLWPPFGGTIRLDGARIDQWDPEALGKYVGYLPQSVELFAGTVKENIARFRADASDEAIVEAATMAHAHDMIMALPNSYETQLGSFGTYLSAGQRQRIGLARALFDNPVLVILDEPNANLDRHGDEALDGAIDGMRKRGQAVVLVSHRIQAIGKADLLLYIDRGVQRAFGSRADVMKMFQGGSNKPEPPFDDRRNRDASHLPPHLDRRAGGRASGRAADKASDRPGADQRNRTG